MPCCTRSKAPKRSWVIIRNVVSHCTDLCLYCKIQSHIKLHMPCAKTVREKHCSGRTAGTVQKIVCNLAKAGSIFIVLKSTGRHCRCAFARLRFFMAEHSMIVSDETNRSLQFTIGETNSSLLFRIDETNRSLEFRIDETNQKLDEACSIESCFCWLSQKHLTSSNWVWLSHFQPDPAVILPSTKCHLNLRMVCSL